MNDVHCLLGDLSEIETALKELEHKIAEIDNIIRQKESPKSFRFQWQLKMVKKPGDSKILSVVPSGKKVLAITIDFKLLGKSLVKKTISERKSAETYRQFFKLMHSQFGSEFLKDCAKFPVSRGPIVSKCPEKDFRNTKKGNLYTHSPIAHTGYFLLTHIGNQQKVKDIKKLARFLKYPPGAILVNLSTFRLL